MGDPIFEGMKRALPHWFPTVSNWDERRAQDLEWIKGLVDRLEPGQSITIESHPRGHDTQATFTVSVESPDPGPV